MRQIRDPKPYFETGRVPATGICECGTPHRSLFYVVELLLYRRSTESVLAETEEMKDLPWFNTKAQLVQLIAAVLGTGIAAVVAWPQIQQNQLLSLGPILFFVLVAIVLLSVRLMLFPPEAPHEIQIISPIGKVMTKQAASGARYFELNGTFKQLSANTEIWAFVKDVSQPRWWPQGPATLNGSNWTISHVYPGTSEKVRLQVYIVGKSGQALIGYHRLVGDVMRRLKDEVSRQVKSVNTDEYKAPAITDLGADVTCVFDKVLPVE
jgi:hypothetical protein